MDRGASEDAPVLIVGGSLVGLSTRAAAWPTRASVRWWSSGTRGTAIHPRAGALTAHVEILRCGGLEDAVRRESEEQYAPDGGIIDVESLAGREIANYFANLNAGVERVQPDGAAVHRPGRARADPARPGRRARRASCATAPSARRSSRTTTA